MDFPTDAEGLGGEGRMTKQTAWRIRVGYGIFLGLFTVAIGIALIATAADLYYSGTAGDIYSREKVAARLAPFIAPAILWVVAAAGGYALSLLFPYAAEKRKNDPRAALRRLRNRMPAGEGEEFLAERAKFARAERVRLIIWTVCAAVGVTGAVFGLVYLFRAQNFAGGDLSAEILAMVRNVFPWVGATLLCCTGAVIYECATAQRDLDRMKRLLVLGRGYPAEAPNPLAVKAESAAQALGSERALFVVRLLVLALGVLFLVLGAVNGGSQDVLIKAINICTECIGLG